eukprot:3544725-Amphidinium_carterae.3
MDQNPRVTTELEQEVGTSTPLCCSHYRNGNSSPAQLYRFSFVLSKLASSGKSFMSARCPTQTKHLVGKHNA